MTLSTFSSEDLRSGDLGRGLRLFSCLSFEERSLAVAACLAGRGLVAWDVIENDDLEVDPAAVRNEMLRIAKYGKVVLRHQAVSKKNPLLLADYLIDVCAAVGSAEDWIVDISTMTHEAALMFVSAIDELAPPALSIRYIYNRAKEYSYNESDPLRRWTSRGVQEVRSVLGFSGLWSPGEEVTMVALPGYDLERAQRVVDEVEPVRLFVGIASPAEPDRGWVKKNAELASLLIEGREQNGATFSYPALDPLGTIDALSKFVPENTQNVLILPLNTKISTVAVGYLARRVPEWQLCYAPALVYNINYARQSDDFMVVDHQVLASAASRAAAQRLQLSSK